MSERARSVEVIEALRRCYSVDSGEWLFFTEAWRIDAFAVRCWECGPGHRRVAFEVKCSRSDFAGELRRPEKRRNALDLSHEFYFATPHGLVALDELPPEAGLIYVRDGRAVVVKEAPVRTPRPFTVRETIYLCRYPLFRQGLLEMRRALRLAEERAEAFAARVEALEAAARAAEPAVGSPSFAAAAG